MFASGTPPKVSILMALYNHEKFVAQAIQSVVGQTFSDWELLIWDDGSKDKSLEIAEAFAKQDPKRIRVFTHADRKNHGQEYTRNQALKEAKGMYVALLDSDDGYFPKKLELLVPLLDEDEQVGLVYGDADWWLDEEKVYLEVRPPASPSGDVFAELIEENFINAMATVFRKAALPSENPFHTSYKTCGEYPVWLTLAREWEVVYLPERVGWWRHHEKNTGTVFQNLAKAELVQIARDFLTDEIQERRSERKDAVLRGLARKLYDLGNEQYFAQDWERAKASFNEVLSISAAPSRILAKALALRLALLLGSTCNQALSRAKLGLWNFRKTKPKN